MLGRRLRELRQIAGLTQGQVAEYAGVSQSTLSDLETGKISPKTIDAIIKLAQYHRRTTDYLLGMNEDTAENTSLSVELDETIAHLIKTIRKLPKYRQYDLLAIAEMFIARKAKDDTLAMDIVLSRVKEVGGIEAERLLHEFFDRLDLGELFGDSSSTIPRE